MMIGPMKKKVITSTVVTAVVLIIIFVAIAFIYVSQNNKHIAELEKRGEVVQRYVFTKDMLQGDIVTASDIALVDVKGESAAKDSYTNLTSMIGRRLKVNANAKTIVTSSLFFEEDKEPSMDTRLQEFNMITLPSDLDVGDYIDIRLRFPTGEDYLVIAGKKIQSFGATESDSNTIFLRLDEEEIVKMGSAIIESYIRDGVLLYANKYVDPDAQLFTYTRVDYVEKYENARYTILDDIDLDNGTVSGESGEMILNTDRKVERTTAEIASIIGLSVEETENIKVALESNDKDTLNFYKDKLVVGEKSITENYPVKPEVATLMKNNPNILNEIKTKYDIAKLEQERIHFLDTDLTKIDEITGEITPHEEHMASIKEKLDKEIEAQRTERQEYLLNLLAKQSTSTDTED